MRKLHEKKSRGLDLMEAGWINHYGPKKYKFWHLALALIVKQECKLGC